MSDLGVSGATGTINIGSGANSSVLRYTGTGDNSASIINLAGTTGGATLDSSGSGALVLSSNLTVTGNGVKTLTLQGSNLNGNSLQGIVPNGASATSLTKAGTGLWIVSGANTYTGTTSISGGALQATDGVGLPTASAQRQLQGGVLQASGTFSRSLGTAAGNVNWASGGGFAATGAPLVVQINGNTNTLVWASTASFVGSGQPLIFSSASANNQVNFENGIDLNGAARTITVNGGGNGDSALLSGVIAGAAGASALTKTGSGILYLSNTYTYAGVTMISGGEVSINNIADGGNASGIGLSGSAAANLILDSGTLQYTGAAASSNRLFTISINSGAIDASGSGPLNLTNTAAIVLSGVNSPRSLTLTWNEHGPRIRWRRRLMISGWIR